MKKITFLRLLSLFVLFFMSCAPVSAQGASKHGSAKRRIAVYTCGKDVYDEYKKVISAKVISAITRSRQYSVIARNSEFQYAIVNDVYAQQSGGEIRTEQITMLADQFGADLVAVIYVSDLFDQLFVASRLINVKTGTVVRANEVSGSADSMNQLLSLSKKVAAGMLGESKGNASAEEKWIPHNLALCVMDRNGKYLYLSPEQWQQTPESTKVFYVKKGVCLMENGDGFLVDMHDTEQSYWDYAYSNGAPKVWQLKLMYKWKDALNQALRIYGGSSLIDTDGNRPWYWSCETCPYKSSRAWYIDMAAGNVCDALKAYATFRVRAVVSLPSSANNSF